MHWRGLVASVGAFLAGITWMDHRVVQGADVLVEAESFETYGGWVLDAQFIDQMGSPYLLAHGLGKPVANARTAVGFPESGSYAVWVRTKDWVPEWNPGRFKVLVNGKELDAVFGTRGRDWLWHCGGAVAIGEEKVTIELVDLTGFDGRCDAVFFTTDRAAIPPRKADEGMYRWRKRLLALPDVPPPAGEFDVVVVGGGIAGCSASLAAARLGCRVALVQNRPVLGGNASPEIGIQPLGLGRSITDEIVSPNGLKVMTSEKTLSLFLGWHAFRVQKEGSRIQSIDARNTRTNREIRFTAPTFIDCTGDGWIGYWAGADYRYGREDRYEFDESLAPEIADTMTHGNTIMFSSRQAAEPTRFPDVPWATAVSKGHAATGNRSHMWEYGQWLDSTVDAEYIRDHLLRSVYGAFAAAKRQDPENKANLELAWVAHVPGVGESRRLMGDHILTEGDLRTKRAFPDTVAWALTPFCLHLPRPEAADGPHLDFQNGPWHFEGGKDGPAPIPFRCLYSRNVSNLLMAGRCGSATHVAYSSIKLMKAGGQMGVAVGCAAYLCKRERSTPREVYKKHLAKLTDLVFERNEYKGALSR